VRDMLPPDVGPPARPTGHGLAVDVVVVGQTNWCGEAGGAGR